MIPQFSPKAGGLSLPLAVLVDACGGRRGVRVKSRVLESIKQMTADTDNEGHDPDLEELASLGDRTGRATSSALEEDSDLIRKR